MACRRCSNHIFILDLTSGFKGFGKDSRKTVRESWECLDLVRLILETWRYHCPKKENRCQVCDNLAPSVARTSTAVLLLKTNHNYPDPIRQGLKALQTGQPIKNRLIHISWGIICGDFDIIYELSTAFASTSINAFADFCSYWPLS